MSWNFYDQYGQQKVANVDAGTERLVLLDALIVSGSVLASYDTNTRLGGALPTDYEDLVITVVGGCDQTSSQYVTCKINADASANYYSQVAGAGGTAVSASQSLGATTWTYAGVVAKSTGNFSYSRLTFPAYNDGVPNVGFSWEASTMLDTGSGNTTRYWGGGGHATISAITLIVIKPTTGNFSIGTRFRLYGIL